MIFSLYLDNMSVLLWVYINFLLLAAGKVSTLLCNLFYKAIEFFFWGKQRVKILTELFLNIRYQTIKYNEENRGFSVFWKKKIPHDIGFTGIFGNSALSARKTKVKNKWNWIKLKSFCTVKETIAKAKWHPTEWRKYPYITHITKANIEDIFKNDKMKIPSKMQRRAQ